MAWVICLTSASSRTMSGAISPRRMRAGTAAAASWVGLESGPGGLDRGVQGVDHLVGDGDRLAGRRVAQRRQAGIALGLGCSGEDLGVADLGGGGFPGRVGDQPCRVVRGGGVGVQGVQGEVGAGVAEVVLLPPS